MKKWNQLFRLCYLIIGISISIITIACINSSNVLSEKMGYKLSSLTYQGSGTESDPYLIYTAEELQGLKDDTEQNYYKLMNDIDLSSIESFEPIGTNQQKPFKGIFDGNGKEIINLSISKNYIKTDDNKFKYFENIGLFGYINGGEVKNLGIKNASIILNNANVKFIGTLAGIATNGTKIENVYAEIEIQLTNCISSIGGLIGYSNANITKCFTNANIDVTAQNTDDRINIGGLIGENYNIDYTAKWYEENEYGNITNSYSNSKIELSCINNEVVSERIQVGGLLGYNQKGNIENVYAISKINVFTKSDFKNVSKVGGLVGYNFYEKNKENNAKNSYYSAEIITRRNLDREMISDRSIKQGEERTLKQMLSESNYSNWDFNNIWQIEPNEGSLPYLINNKNEEIMSSKLQKRITKQEDLINIYNKLDQLNYEGQGTQENPYLIKTAEQLQGIERLNLKGKYYYKLANDIDASTIDNFIPIGRTIGFDGILDGDNYTISNLTINSDEEFTGLFSFINGGRVKNINIDNINVNATYSGNYSYVGGMCGYNIGDIENVKIEGKIKNTGTSINLYLGGVLGYNNVSVKKA